MNKNSKLRSFRIKPLRSRLLLTAEEKQRHNIIFLRFERFEVGSHRRFHFFIFSKIGMTCSKVGLLPGSSFMQILISLAMWLDMPGEISTRRPSVEIWNEQFFCWIQKSIATGSFIGASLKATRWTEIDSNYGNVARSVGIFKERQEWRTVENKWNFQCWRNHVDHQVNGLQ